MTARRLLAAFALLVVLVHLGALGFYHILEGQENYFRCLYRTVLLVTTVNDPQGFPQVSSDRARLLEQYTMVILILGMGVVLYSVSSLAAWIIEGDLRGGVRRRRTRRMLESYQEHIIVCGGGETGQLMSTELLKIGERFVVIENDPHRFEELEEIEGLLALRGDATHDQVLEAAGIDRARGIIAALPGDKENVFVVITARQLNPKVKIVARSVDPMTDRKLELAGADVVVAANTIAANRMVSALVRPHVVSFIDRLMRDPKSQHRIEEIEIAPRSTLDGVTLGESQLASKTGLLVLAVQPAGAEFRCNPGSTVRLAANMRLVVLGELRGLAMVRDLAGVRAEV
ncbi:MAG: TrkA family potassium uptake protein [Planctomycetes bacterium]|nr:TrkA family potassium uptake protein [Planctomycetota bacterium]